MAPGLLNSTGVDISALSTRNILKSPRSPSSYLLNRNVRTDPLRISRREGQWAYLADGRKLLEGSGGAGVLCIGAKDERVRVAYNAQFDTGVMYEPSMDFYTDPAARLAQFLVESTDNKLTRAVFFNSGMLPRLRFDLAGNPKQVRKVVRLP